MPAGAKRRAYHDRRHTVSDDVDINGSIEEANAALLLEYLGGADVLNEKQLAAGKVKDRTKERADMLDVIAILDMI